MFWNWRRIQLQLNEFNICKPSKSITFIIIGFSMISLWITMYKWMFYNLEPILMMFWCKVKQQAREWLTCYRHNPSFSHNIQPLIFIHFKHQNDFSSYNWHELTFTVTTFTPYRSILFWLLSQPYKYKT